MPFLLEQSRSHSVKRRFLKSKPVTIFSLTKLRCGSVLACLIAWCLPVSLVGRWTCTYGLASPCFSLDGWLDTGLWIVGGGLDKISRCTSGGVTQLAARPQLLLPAFLWACVVISSHWKNGDIWPLQLREVCLKLLRTKDKAKWVSDGHCQLQYQQRLRECSNST